MRLGKREVPLTRGLTAGPLSMNARKMSQSGNMVLH
jgi:hypothetical protein